jgi:chromosome segregation ATPase
MIQLAVEDIERKDAALRVARDKAERMEAWRDALAQRAERLQQELGAARDEIDMAREQLDPTETTLADAIKTTMRTTRKLLHERDQARAAADANQTETIAYQGELELTAEQLGAESIATIRDEIRDLQDRAQRAGQREQVATDAYNGQQQSYRELEALYSAMTERAQKAEASNASLYYAAWEIVNAPMTEKHLQGASDTYMIRRKALRDLLQQAYPGRQLLAQLEAAHDAVEAWTAYQAQGDVKVSNQFYQLGDALDRLVKELAK